MSGLRKPTGGEIYLDDRAYGKMPERERVATQGPASLGVVPSAVGGADESIELDGVDVDDGEAEDDAP